MTINKWYAIFSILVKSLYRYWFVVSLYVGIVAAHARYKVIKAVNIELYCRLPLYTIQKCGLFVYEFWLSTFFAFTLWLLTFLWVYEWVLCTRVLYYVVKIVRSTKLSFFQLVPLNSSWFCKRQNSRFYVVYLSCFDVVVVASFVHL